MRAEIGIIFLFVAVAYATETPTSTVHSAYDYHRRFGIPHAQKIKQIEDGIKSDQRVAGGSFTTTISTPYQAGILLRVLLYTSVCGGALINDRTILSAARCFDDGNLFASSITIVLGSNFLFSGGHRVSDCTVTVHPEFNPRTMANDIAVTHIPPVETSLTLSPIETPISTSEISNDYVGTNAVASGYGITADGSSVSLFQTINSATLEVISNEECRRTYGGGLIQNTHLCTSGVGGVGLCDGDIGGPLVANVGFLFRRILIGIGSFYSAEGCEAGHPSGFTRITSFLGWIYSV